MGKKLPIITRLPDSHEEIVARYIIEKRPQAIAERESFARGRRPSRLSARQRWR